MVEKAVKYILIVELMNNIHSRNSRLPKMIAFGSKLNAENSSNAPAGKSSNPGK